MKKIITLSICTALGGAAGYFAAPMLGAWMAQSLDPGMFSASMLAGYKNAVVCDCNNQPPGESLKRVSDYLAAVQRFRQGNQTSNLLAQETGLTYVRLSMLEAKLGQQAQADDDMKHGQAELKAIGWRDTSNAHLISLITQLNSEYQSAFRRAESLSTLN